MPSFSQPLLPPVGDAEAILEYCAAFSGYARRQLEIHPDWRKELLETLPRPFTRREMDESLAAEPVDSEDALLASLRRLRGRVYLRLMARDLGGLAGLAEVCETMTHLAECAVGSALAYLDTARRTVYGDPVGEGGRPQQLIVVGMGKLGGRELNASSDIDLIFVYPEDGGTSGPKRISNHEYFSLLGKALINALNQVTADGHVFRVDMRLRPYGDAGPLAMSFAMLEEYLFTQGREWERYAWIKGRPLTPGEHDELMAIVRPFVYRKYLDFDAFGAMRSLHAQISAEVKRRDLADNIKLGPGGIREIEFSAQVFQLIRGGRVPALQVRPTLRVLDELARRELLPESTSKELAEAYVFLRHLEHRLQYREDQQTQTLPESSALRGELAKAMGYASEAEFMEALEQQRQRVRAYFDRIFGSPQAEASYHHPLADLWQGSLSNDEVVERLAELGFFHPKEMASRLEAHRQGRCYLGLSKSGRGRMDAIIPPIIEVSTATAEPDLTLGRILDLLCSVSRRSSYLALLNEYPVTLRQVAKLCSASDWLARYLAQHPILLDELLDARRLSAEPDEGELALELDDALAAAGEDAEAQMEAMRQFKHSQTFRLAARDVGGLATLESLSDHLSNLADLLLARSLDQCWKLLRVKHRDIPRFAVIGYGKLGGKELGYASDLDIIFLFDDADPQAPEVYASLARRMNNWLNTYTPSGMLYETDLRLRPDGNAGLLVSEIGAFAEYQRKHAWVWEHQALTRARFVAGAAEVGEAFSAIRREILVMQRDKEALRREIGAMRAKMREGHANHSGLFDLKHDAGGIVDVEFIVQYYVLGFAHLHPELAENRGNITLLSRMADAGLVDPRLARQVANGYRELRRAQHRLRLASSAYARLPREELGDIPEHVLELWEQTFGPLRGGEAG